MVGALRRTTAVREQHYSRPYWWSLSAPSRCMALRQFSLSSATLRSLHKSCKTAPHSLGKHGVTQRKPSLPSTKSRLTKCNSVTGVPLPFFMSVYLTIHKEKQRVTSGRSTKKCERQMVAGHSRLWP